MNDVLLVSGVEADRDLPGKAKALVNRQRPGRNAFREGHAVDELENQRGRMIFNAVDRADVGMIERRQQPGLALEASEAFLVRRPRTAAGS